MLNQGRDTTTIREEVRHLENYLLIQNNRYGDRITFRVETDETLLDCACPKLLLQPLVENAIGHGLERKVGPGCVTVTLWREAGSIRFRVADDGVGTDGAAITARMAGPGDDVFALKNIQERIRLRYGEPYGITFTSRPGEGTVVEGLLPGEGAPS